MHNLSAFATSNCRFADCCFAMACVLFWTHLQRRTPTDTEADDMQASGAASQFQLLRALCPIRGIHGGCGGCAASLPPVVVYVFLPFDITEEARECSTAAQSRTAQMRQMHA